MFDETLTAYWTFVAFILGALFGSFGNVCILRIPNSKSVVTPRSSCMKCGTAIRWYDNVPIFSWVVLGGKCRTCKESFSIRYMLVEVLMGLFFALTFWKFHFSWTLLEILILIFGLVVVSVIDLDHFLIPDKFSLPGIALGLIGGIINPERTFLDAVLGIFMGGGFLWAVAYVYYLLKKEEGLGGGDIKLLAWIGAVLGWKCVPFVILFSSIFGSVVGVSLIVKSKGNLKTVIPFGPYIALAAIIYIFWGEDITNWYLSVFMPGI